MLYLALEHIAKKWTMPVANWKAALQRFAILLGDRARSRAGINAAARRNRKSNISGMGLAPNPEILRFRARIAGPEGELRSRFPNPGP